MNNNITSELKNPMSVIAVRDEFKIPEAVTVELAHSNKVRFASYSPSATGRFTILVEREDIEKFRMDGREQ